MGEFGLSREEIERFNTLFSKKYAIIGNTVITFMRSDLKKILAICLKDAKKLPYPDRDFTRQEMADIFYQFLRDTDIDLYINLLNILRDPAVKTYMTEPSPNNRDEDNYNSAGLNGRILSISPKNNAGGLIQVCHELSHMLSQRMQKNMSARDHTIGEIEALFIEKIFAQYLKDNGIISQYEFDAYKSFRNYKLAADTAECIMRHAVFSLTGGNIDEEKVSKLVRYAGNQMIPDYILPTLKKMANPHLGYNPAERYVLGEAVSSLLFEEYKKDKEGTMEKFKNFLSHNAQITYKDATQELLGKRLKEVSHDFLDFVEREHDESEKD